MSSWGVRRFLASFRALPLLPLDGAGEVLQAGVECHRTVTAVQLMALCRRAPSTYFSMDRTGLDSYAIPVDRACETAALVGADDLEGLVDEDVVWPVDAD